MHMDCPKCGKPFDADSESCPHCGVEFPAEAAAETPVLGAQGQERAGDTGNRSAANTLFGELAIEMGILQAVQVEECLGIQKAMAEMGVKQHLGEIMVSKGYLTRDGQRDLLREQTKRTGRHILMGHYEMIAKLGEGGMGAVYRAKDQQTGAVVAVKVLPKHLASDMDYVVRFRREAELASKLDHPNIVRAIEAGEASGYHYFAMEYVEGYNLATQLGQAGRIREGEALHIVRDVAMALEHAHASGLVHRDIKPANVFLAKGGAVKLGDMGLAKETDAEVTQLTQSGMVMGTPHYISPEQAEGRRDIDIRSDIYSLGAMLYHMLTGEVPFDGATPLAILNKHLTEDLPWPADINDELTDEVCSLVQRMMAKDREDRYQDPLHVIQDIDRVIRGEAPDTAVLAVGRSSIRKAVRSRGPGEAAERRRRRLAADADRAPSVAMPDPRVTRREVPSAQSSSVPLLGVGIGVGVAMLVVAGAIFLSTPGQRPDPARVRRDRGPGTAEAGKETTTLPGTMTAAAPGQPVESGRINYGNASVKDLGGGRKEIVWEFDKPLDPKAWDLENVLEDDAGSGVVRMDFPGGNIYYRALTLRTAFDGDLKVEATFSGLGGRDSKGRPGVPFPELFVRLADSSTEAVPRAAGFFHWPAADRVKPSALPAGWQSLRENVMKIARRRGSIEFSYSSPAEGQLRSLGVQPFSTAPVSLTVGLFNNYHRSYTARLERLRVVGRSADRGHAERWPGVPRKATAAEQWKYAYTTTHTKGYTRLQQQAACRAQILHYPKSIKEVGGEGALYYLVHLGQPAEAIALWDRVRRNFTDEDAVKAGCILHAGRAYCALGRKREGLDLLRRGREVHADYAYFLGWAYYNFAEYGSAVKEWEYGLTKWPADWRGSRIKCAIAQAYHKKGDLEQALAAYRSVLQKWPKDKARCDAARKAIAEIEGESKAKATIPTAALTVPDKSVAPKRPRRPSTTAARAIPAEVRALFKGNITSYDSKTREIELHYDFSSADQLADWSILGKWRVDEDAKEISGRYCLKLFVWFDPASLEVSYTIKGKQSLNSWILGKRGNWGWESPNSLIFRLGHWGNTKSGVDGCEQGAMAATRDVKATGKWQKQHILLEGNTFTWRMGKGGRLIGAQSVPQWQPEEYVKFGVLAGYENRDSIAVRDVRVKGKLNGKWLKERIREAGRAAAPDLARKLAAYWSFNRGDARDGWGAHHGKVRGARRTVGKVGAGLLFDGKDDWVEVPDFNVEDNLTISLWANPSTDRSAQCLIGRHNKDGNDIVGFGFWDDLYRLRIGPHMAQRVRPRTGWQHLVMVLCNEDRHNTKAALYRDGNLLWQRRIAYSVGVAKRKGKGKGWAIGQDWDGQKLSDFFSGVLDEIAVWDRTLTPEEVKLLYEKGVRGEQVVAGPSALPPAPKLDAATVQKFFKGRVVSFNPRTSEVELLYDLASTEQREDWKTYGKWSFDAAEKCMTGNGSLVLWVPFVATPLDVRYQTKGKWYLASFLVADGGGWGWSQKNCMHFMVGHWNNSCGLLTGCGRSKIAANSKVKATGKWQDVEVLLRGNVFTFTVAPPREVVAHQAVPEWKPKKFVRFGLGGGHQGSVASVRKVHFKGRLPQVWLQQQARGLVTPERLHAALKLANPEYEGDGKFTVKGGRIVGVDLRRSKVKDISPLRGMPLVWVNLSETQVEDLSPLRGLALGSVAVSRTPVRSIAALEEAPLYSLDIRSTAIADLRQMKKIKALRRLSLTGRGVDLAVLRELPITQLILYDAPSVEVLQGLKLKVLHLRDIDVVNAAVLRQLPLVEFHCRGLDVDEYSLFGAFPHAEKNCPWLPYLAGKITADELRRRSPRHPNWADYYPFYIGMKLEHEGKLAEAIAAYEEGLEITGHHSTWLLPQAQLKIAGVHRRAGDLKKSIAAYREVLGTWPEDKVACDAARKAISEIEAEAKTRDK